MCLPGNARIDHSLAVVAVFTMARDRGTDEAGKRLSCRPRNTAEKSEL